MSAWQKVIDEARQLSREEKEDLIEILRAELEDEPRLGEAERQEVEQAWVEEAERRLDDYLAGKTQGIPAQEVFRDILPQRLHHDE